jgi:hypothetical protein
MAVNVQTILDDRIAQYVNRVKAQRHATEAAVVRELVEAGYAETVRQLHARYQRGELMFRAVAAELGLSVRELYELCEQKGLSTYNCIRSSKCAESCLEPPSPQVMPG